MVSHPRVGSEVMVTWLDGEPDHPAITGVVYNEAMAHITDMGETVARLTQGHDLHEGLSEAAKQSKAHDEGDSDKVAQKIKKQNDEINGSGIDVRPSKTTSVLQPFKETRKPQSRHR
jgi:uncharacterized protein involved in type VI secretion and phage assembly